MKRKISLLALVLAILMCFLTVAAVAGSNKENSKMPFVDSEQISPEHPEIVTEDDFMEEFETMFGEKGGAILYAMVAGLIVSALFLPCLILVIVFGVLNSKTKKKVREYERFFGPIPENVSPYYNNNPYYNTQHVNPMNSPMGTPPSQNTYMPENNTNQWQGGQF